MKVKAIVSKDLVELVNRYELNSFRLCCGLEYIPHRCSLVIGA